MEKLKCVVQAPFDFYSNYGDKSREFIINLLSIRKDWEISLVYTIEEKYQGHYLKDHNDTIITSIASTMTTPKDADLFIQFAPGNILKKCGKINVGVVLTEDLAGPENYPQWIDGCNGMDYIITYSSYSRETLQNLQANNIKITKPINILREYSMFNDIVESEEDILKDVKNEWNFLVECYWNSTLGEELGSSNKNNMTTIIKNFLNTFKDIDNAPGLIIHSGGSKKSINDKDKMLKKIYSIRESVNYNKSLPNIHLIYGNLNNEETKKLYNDDKVKVLVNISQREDIIQQQLNFMAVGKPIIYANWSALKEFTNHNGNYPINGEIKHFGDVGPKLIDVFINDYNMSLYSLFYHYNDYVDSAKKNDPFILNKLSKQNYLNVLDQILKFGSGK